MKRAILSTICALLTSISFAYGQPIKVSGAVSDATTGEALAGVIVAVKEDLSKATMTDEKGRYEIEANANSMLKISYLGYATQEIRVAGKKMIDVQLQLNAMDLETVIVVGVSMKKSDLTGAVGSVSSKVLKERPVTNINQALQGRVAGVLISTGTRPGDDTSIKIRGINTINTNSDPIYVVDGLVMDNHASGFSVVNMYDVASVEILKDASATALYGSRASNGVVLITTKKGVKGEGRVTYDGWVGIQEFANTPKVMNAQQSFELRRNAYANGFVAANPGGDRQQYIDNIVMGTNDVFANYEFDAYRNGEDYNWLDQVTRTGIQHNHAVSFSKGTDKGSFFISFGYSDNKALVKESGQTRYTGRINADQEIKSWLKVGTNTTFTRTEDQLVEDGVFDKARGANRLLAIDRDVPTLNYQGKYDENSFNPIRTLMMDKDRFRNRLLSSNFLNINPIKGLNIRTTLSVDFANEAEYRYIPTNIHEAVRYSTNGEAKHNKDDRLNWQWDNTVSYETQIGLHGISGMFGTSTTKSSRRYNYITAIDFISDYFSYNNLGGARNKEKVQYGSGYSIETMMSYFLRANYNYSDRYYLTVTARYDGSSKFGKGNKWGLFPSFSGAWNIANESFMKEQRVVNQLKLRVGFGIVGNQNIDNFTYLSLYEPRVNAGIIYSDSDGRRGTKNIKWERQKQWNVGLDMAFLNNRIRASFDMFLIENDDLLMTRNLATTTGYRRAIENIGAIENKGVEFSIDATALQLKNFTWNISANISADKNKVTKLYGDAQVIYKVSGDQQVEKEENLFIGQSRNTIYTYLSGGVAQQADMDRLNGIDFRGRKVNPGDLYVLDVFADNRIDEKDKVVIGSTDPKFYGGFSTDFTYKNVSLNASFTYSYGAKKLSPYYESVLGSTGTGPASLDLLNAWTPENTNTNIPRVIAGHSYPRFGIADSDYSVQDASYLKLSNITLSYSLPSHITNKLRLGTVRVYVTGHNLLTVTNYKGYDPETGDWYPPTRMYVFGLNLSF